MHGLEDRSGRESPEVAPAPVDPPSVPHPTPGSQQLRYLYDRHPKGPETFEVAPGILWARVPLPFRLNHVNVWLLRDADGWTIVDTGTASTEARALWEALLGSVLSGAPIVRLVATHGHTDHVGLASWLTEIGDGCPFHISLVEWQSARIRVEEVRHPMPASELRFLERHGCDAETVASFASDRARTHAYLKPLPNAITRLREGSRIAFGGREWVAIACGGHAPEHISLWSEQDRILIAGDQVLSKITPSITVKPEEPDADPLAEYLASLDRFRRLPADALVLCSHGLPFHGLGTRVEQLAAHHAERLATLEELMREPATAMRLAHGLFPRAVAEGAGRGAFSETLAHAHLLVNQGRAERREVDGRWVFVAK